MLRFRRAAVAILVLLTLCPALWPTAALGQEKAGIVTTLEGNVTAARSAIPQPITLKFKDDVYRNDRITTGDRSLARMLLGGKAVVTVRERSVITITEVPGKSTIELAAGKIGLAVAKERMKPGEQIEIKTPNAVCAVRGTVVVAEVESRTAQAGGGPAGVVSSFYVLRGAVEAFQLVPGTGTIVGAPLAVGTLQAFTRAGSAPPHVAPIPPGQLAQITGGLTPSGMGAKGAPDQMVEGQMATAGALADFVGGSGLITPVVPIVPTGGGCPPPCPPPPSGPALVNLDAATVTQPGGGSLISIGPGAASTPTSQTFTGAQNLGPNGFLATGSFPSIDVPLFLAENSTINTPNSTVLSVTGTLTNTVASGNTVASELMKFDPTTVTATTIANISGTLNLAGSLLTDAGGTFTMGGDFAAVSGSLTQTGPAAGTAPGLLVLNGTTVQRQDEVAGVNLATIAPAGQVTLAGLMLDATNGNLQLGTGTVLNVAGSLTANSPGGVLRIDPTTVTAGTLASISGSLNLAGPLLTDILGAYTIGNDFLTVSGILNQTGGPATLLFQGSQVTVGGNLVTVPGQATVSGLLVGAIPDGETAANVKLTVGGSLLALGGTLTSTAPAGVLFLDPTVVDAASVANISGALRLAGPLLSDVGGTYNMAGDFVTVSGTIQGAPETASALPALLVLNGTTVQPQPGAAGTSLVTITPTATVSVDGLVLEAINANLQLGTGTVLNVAGGLSANSPDGVLRLDPTMVSAASVANIAGAALLVGPLLTDTGGTFNVSGDFVSVSGLLTQTGAPTESAPALLNFGGSTVNSGTGGGHAHFFQVNGGSVELARPLVAANASSLTQNGFAFLEVAGNGDAIAQLTGNSTSPFINFTGGSLTLGPGVYGAYIENGLVSVAGGFLKATGTQLATGMDRPFIQLIAGGLSTGAGPVLDLTGVNLNLGAQPVVSLNAGSALFAGSGGIRLTNGSLTADALVVSDGSGNFLGVTGTILDLVSSSVQLRAIYTATGEDNTDNIGITPAGQPLFRLSNSHLTLTGDDLVTITGTGATDTPLVVATGNSSLQVSGTLLVLSGELSSSAAAGLFSFDPTSVTAASIANISGTLNLTGPLLVDAGGTYNVSGDFVSVSGTLAQTSAPAGSGLFTFNGSTVNSGTDLASTHFFRVDGGTATLVAPLLLATSSAITQRGFALIEATAGGQLTGNSSGPFVDLTGGSLTLGPGVRAVFVDAGAAVNVAGGLFKASGTVLSGATGAPFVQLINGALTTGGPALELVDTTLNLGGQPIVSAGGGSTLVIGGGGAFKLTSSTLIADAFYVSDGSGNHLTLNGIGLDAINSSVTLRVTGDDSNLDTATFNLVAGQPLFRLQDSHLTLTEPGEPFVGRGSDGAPIPTENGVGLIATGGSITIAGPLLDLGGIILTDSHPQVQLTNVIVNQSNGPLVEVFGQPVTTSGGLLRATGGSLTTDGSLLSVQWTNLTVNDQSAGANRGVIDLRSFNALALGAGAAAVRVSDATVTSNLPLLSLLASSLTGLTGSILDIGMNSNLTLTDGAPALLLEGSSAGAGVSFVAIGSSGGPGTGPVVSLSGSLLEATGAGIAPLTLSSGGDRSFVSIFDGAQVTQTGSDAFVRIVGSGVNGIVVAAGGNIVSVGATAGGRPAPTLTLSGSLIEASSARLQSGDPAALVRSGVFIADGAVVAKTDATPAPLISLDAVNAVLAGNVVSVRRSPSAAEPTTLDLGANPLLVATDSSISTSSPIGLGGGPCCSGFFVAQGARLLGTGADALIQLSATTFNAGASNVSGGNFFSVSNACPTCGDAFNATVLPATVSLGGALLGASDSSITALFSLLQIGSSSFASTGSAPLISLDNTSVTLGGIDPFTGSTTTGRVLNLNSAGTLALRGGLLDAVDSSIVSTSTGVGVFSGGALTQTLTNAALLRLDDTTVTTTTTGGHVVHVSGAGSQISLSGSLIDALNGTVVTAFGNLVRIADGGTLTSSGVAAAVSWTSGSFTGAPAGSVAGGSLLRMFSGAGLPDSTLTLLGGPYLAAASATFSSPDAPTFSIADGARISSATSLPFAQFAASTVTSGSDFFTVTNNSSFTTPGQPTTFGSGVAPIVNVNGTLVRATGGTIITSAGALFALSNGAALTETASGGGQPPLFDIVSSSVTSGRSMFALSAGEGLAAPRLELAGPLVRATSAQLSSGTPGSNTFTTIFVGDGALLRRTDSSGVALVDLTDTAVTTAGNIVTLRRSVSAGTRSRIELGANPLLVASGSTLTTANPGGIAGGPCCNTFFIGQGAELTGTGAGALITLLNTTVNSGSSGVSGGSFFGVTDTSGGTVDAFNATTLASSVTLGGGLLNSQDSTISALFSGLNVNRSAFTAGAGSPLFQVNDTADRTWSFGGVSPLPSGGNPAGTETFGSFVLVSAGVPTTGPLGDATLTLNNGLLSVTNAGGRTTFRTTGDFISVLNGASLVHTDQVHDLITSSHASYDVRSGTTPTTAHRFFVNVFGMGGASGTRPSTMSVAGRLLESTGDLFNIASALVGLNSGGLTPAEPVWLDQTTGTSPLLAFHGSVVNLGAAAGGVAGAGNLAQVNGNTQMRLNGPLAFIETLGAQPWQIDRFVLARCGAGFACVGVGTAGLETFTVDALVRLVGTPLSNGIPVAHTLSQAMFDLAGIRTAAETDPDGVDRNGVALTVGTDQPLRHAGVLFRGESTRISVGNVVRIDTALLAATAPIVSLLASQMTVQHHAIDLVNQAKLAVNVPLDAVFRLDASTLTIVGSSLANVSNSFMKVVGSLFALHNGSTLTINDGALVTVSNRGVFRLTAGSLGFFGAGSNLLHILNTSGGGVFAAAGSIPNLDTTLVPVFLLNGAQPSQVVVATGFVPFAGLGGANTVDIGEGAAALVVDGTTARIVLGDFTAVTHLNVVNIVQNPNLQLTAAETLDAQLANLVGLGEFGGGATLIKVQNRSRVTQAAGGNLVVVPADATVTLGGLLFEVSDSEVHAGNAVVRVDGVLSAPGLLRFDPAGATGTTMAEINGTVSLAGSLFTDVRGTFDLAGNFVKVRGTLTTSISTALLDFDRSSVVVGQAMLDLAGVNTASDPGEGITVGTDRPLRHAGTFVQAKDAAATVGQIARIDTALLEATKPVVDLLRSSLIVQGNALDLVDRAKLTAGTVQAPITALYNLNASSLTVAGSLVNVANSLVQIIGNLFSLTGGSTLTVNGGGLVTASGTGVFQLTGGSLGVFGTGTNTLNITTSGGGTFATPGSIPNLDTAKVPVLLRNNANAAQVTVNPGFVPFSGVNGTTNTVNIPNGSAALIVDGTSAKIKLGP